MEISKQTTTPQRQLRRRPQFSSKSCRKTPVVMARIVFLFLISIACILIYSRILIPQTTLFFQEVPPLIQQQRAASLIWGDNDSRIRQNSTTIRPRVLVLDETLDMAAYYQDKYSYVKTFPITNATANRKSPKQYILKHQRPFYNQCKLMHAWQKRFYPTCNCLHEMDWASTEAPKENATRIELLSDHGSWRMVWKVPVQHSNKNESLAALKMLHFHRDYNEESYQHAIADAIAMERLTSSPHAVHAFGYCGQSVVTEWAPATARSLVKDNDFGIRRRIVLARDLALGLHDLHYMKNSSKTPSFVHNDINIANMVQTSSGHIKYNDFNIGVFLRTNTTSKKPCGFPVDFASPRWRSPEEIQNKTYVSEKVDVFSLGNVYFHILVKHEPWNHLEPGGPPPLDVVERKKAKGQMPFLPEKHANTTRIEKRAFIAAYKACFQFNPKNRPTALELSRAFDKVIEWEKRKKKPTEKELNKLFHLVEDT